ncbi:MAG: polysaccharide biosynthesis C-terminal domain-containing protein [Gammaproteobacteria bacterium]|nr:polysaccharide biosynthesis C-terminal domain-containing protein [Gammaproteobacteria bacterium]
MSRAALILRNVAVNWTGFAVNALVTLILTPFVLRELGGAAYGVWVLTSSVIGYYGLLDLGLRGGVTQFLTRYLAIGDHRGAGECMSSALAALGVVCLVVILLTAGMAYAAPHIFHIPAAMRAEASWCIAIVGCAGALQFVLFPFAAVLTAMQRFDIANAIGASSRLLFALGTYLALRHGLGLLGIAAAACIANTIDYGLRWRAARRLIPLLRLSLRSVSRARLREIVSFGAWNFPISVASYAELHAETLVIGILMPIAAAGYYALATGLVLQIGAVLAPISQVMYPTAVAFHARNEQSGLERLCRDGSRLVLLATVTVVCIASFWAGDFYRLWVGEQYVSGAVYPSLALLLRILLLGTLAGYASNIAGQILLGSGEVRLLAMALIGRTTLAIALMFVLIPRFGLLGVAAASAATAAVVYLFVIPRMLHRAVAFPVGKPLLQAAIRPGAVAVILCPLLLVIRLAGPAGNWPELAAQGLLAGVAAAAAILMVGMTRDERARFIARPLRRLSVARVPGGRSSQRSPLR